MAGRGERKSKALAKVESDGLGVGRKAGLMAGAAGLGALGTAAGVSAAKALRQRKAVRDAYEGEDFHLLDADRGCVITTPDEIGRAHV